MQPMRRYFVLLVMVVFCLSLLAYSQDSPSLGDVARQSRQQKQSTPGKDTQGKTSSAAKVITNDEIPEHPDTSVTDDDSQPTTEPPSAPTGTKIPAEQWKSQIKAQKDAVASLQSNMERLNELIQFAPGNCVSGCVQWNERQKQKQREVERMRSQLQTQKKRLTDMQEAARRQGYGSSVYEP